jgi:hypothetical protein
VMYDILILAARPFFSNYKTIGDLDSPLLMPMNGHTLLDEIISLYPLNRLLFVINKAATRSCQLVEARSQIFTNVEKFEVPFELMQSGPASTVMKVISQRVFKPNDGLIVMFGDSLIQVNQNFESKVPIVIGAKSSTPERYSHFSFNKSGTVLEFFEKGVSVAANENILSEVGAYYFPNLSELRDLSFLEPLNQMSDLLNAYPEVQLEKPISWVDFGHWDAAISNFFSGKARSFNNLQISQNSQFLTKSSSDSSKIQNEYQYLASIPETLKFYFPRVQPGSNDASYKIEFWPVKSLSEYFVFWNMPNSSWQKVANNLIESLAQFASVFQDNDPIPSNLLFEFYSKKMFDRLSIIDGPVSNLLNQEVVFLNGEKLKGFPIIKQELIEKLENLSKDTKYSFAHGDFCFSNILIEPSTMMMKFIDPRGSFCGEKQQGDLRYDAAKLRHSFHGLYDFIVNDMYSLKILSSSSFELNIVLSENYPVVYKIFNEALENYFGSDAYSQVKILEGTLFLSMLPLHSENQNRQIAFALTALSILNKELLCENLL